MTLPMRGVQAWPDVGAIAVAFGVEEALILVAGNTIIVPAPAPNELDRYQAAADECVLRGVIDPRVWTLLWEDAENE